MTNKGIAIEMGISAKTVDWYIRRMRDMFNLKCRASLVKLATGFHLTSQICLLCLFLIGIGSVKAEGPVAITNNMVTLAWVWPTNFWQTTQNQMQTVFTNPTTWPALTNLVYRMYQTTTLAGTNTQWVLTATIVNPPPTTNANGSVWILLTVPMVPWTQNFYALTASNVIGSSFFSSLAGTSLPPPSQGDFLIQATH